MTPFGPYRGVVDQVHDGDTVNVRLDLGFDLTVYARVRVFGINAPELSTDDGKLARDYARALLPDGAPPSTRPPYLSQAIVFNDAQDFGQTMINSGHAVAYP